MREELEGVRSRMRTYLASQASPAEGEIQIAAFRHRVRPTE